MNNAAVFWANTLVGNVTGLVLMLVLGFVVVHAVLEWRATHAARRIGVADAESLHVRLDALGRQLDDLQRLLTPGYRAPSAADAEPTPNRPSAARPRHATPVS